MVIIYSILLFIFYFIYSNAKETINILINKPDFDENEYLEKYNEVINQYFVMNKIDEYDIKFSYCTPTTTDGEHLSQIYKDVESPFSIDVEYARNFNCTLRELKNSKYDIMILDDRFLYGDNSYVDYVLLKNEFGFNKLSDFYVDYNSYNNINKEDISYHDIDILNDGKIDSIKNLYGLPYELDFDLLYYHTSNVESKDLLSLKVTDSSFKNNNISEEILSAGFNDKDELFNFFSEFIRYQYNKPIKNDPKSYEFLCNNEAVELYDFFRKYVLRFTGTDIEKTLSTTIEEAYTTFLHDEHKLFRGKASHYKKLKENPNISIQINSLPNEITVMTEKYVVINKNSLKSIEDLLKIAHILSSKEMQIYRSIHMGSIPTFKFKELSSDEAILSFCQLNLEMCEILNKLNPIRIRNIYIKNCYSASYLETRLIAPLELTKTLIDPTKQYAKIAFMNLLDISSSSFTDEMKITVDLIIFMILYVLTIVIAIFLLGLMIKVYFNRKHPYIKAMSPQLTNLTIFGIILRLIFPYFYSIVNTKFLCHLGVVLNFFVNNIVYLPLFAIIFRIYYIYTKVSNVSIGRKLNDRHLIAYIIITLIISVIIYSFITYFDQFNIETNGSIKTTRLVICFYNTWKYAIISGIYDFILVRIFFFFFFFFFFFYKNKLVKIFFFFFFLSLYV